MVEAPPFVKSHGRWCKELLDASGKVRIARCRILQLVQFSRNAAEIVEGFRGRADGHSGVLNVPVRRHTEDCLRPRQPCADCSPLLCIGVAEQGIHRAAVAEED